MSYLIILYFNGDSFTIVIAVGTNDSKGKSEPDALQVPHDEFRENLKKILDIAKSHTSSVLMLGLLPVDETRTNPFEDTYFTNARIQEYNVIIKEVCGEKEIPLLELYDEFIANSDYITKLADGLHPNTEGYDWMFEKVKGFLIQKEILN